MDGKQIQLFTRLQPRECASRLSAAIDAEPELWKNAFKGTPWVSSTGKPVIGEVSESFMRLRKRTPYRNSFQTLLTAKLEPVAEGTLIEGKLAMRSWVWPFMFVWFLFLAIFGGLAIVFQAASLLNGERSASIVDDGAPILVLLMMAAFGIGIMHYGRTAARDEAQFLRDFVIQTLDAHPADTKD
jgi:hypothetical protein